MEESEDVELVGRVSCRRSRRGSCRDVTPAVKCPICGVKPGVECTRFDDIAKVTVPLGYPHYARVKLAEELRAPIQLTLEFE